MNAPGSIFALDVGTRTIGVANTDPTRQFVFPNRTVARVSVRRDTEALVRLAVAHGGTLFVVGLPLTPDGVEARSARLARQIGESVAAATGLPVVYMDERFSTCEADWRLTDAGVHGRLRKAVVDQHAAVVILEDWLAQNPARTSDTSAPAR